MKKFILYLILGIIIAILSYLIFPTIPILIPPQVMASILNMYKTFFIFGVIILGISIAVGLGLFLYWDFITDEEKIQRQLLKYYKKDDNLEHFYKTKCNPMMVGKDKSAYNRLLYDSARKANDAKIQSLIKSKEQLVK